MGILITFICIFFYIKSPEGSPFFLRGKDFSGFFFGVFPGGYYHRRFNYRYYCYCYYYCHCYKWYLYKGKGFSF